MYQTISTPSKELYAIPEEEFVVLDEQRYQTSQEIGRGGMGIVYRVYDSLLKRHLAMKEISSKMKDRPESRARFLTEAQTMASLQHPSIISVHDLGITKEGKLFFLMDQVEGKTMTTYIRRLHEASSLLEWTQEQWGFRRIIESFYRVCETIAYVHEKGFVHLDIKPYNIQFGQRGEVWVLDWGVARKAHGEDEKI